MLREYQQRAEVKLFQGDCRDVLKTLPDASVHCVVTSPPYWGAQRDYGMDAQLGMERTPEEFVASLVGVFNEIARCLRPDGVLWLNIGDSYAASGKGGGGKMMLARGHQWGHRAHLKGWRSPPPGQSPAPPLHALQPGGPRPAACPRAARAGRSPGAQRGRRRRGGACRGLPRTTLRP